MIYKRFRINTIGRILLLSSTIYLFFYMVMYTNLYATIVIVLFTAAYQVYALIHFVEKTNRDLSRFLLAIKHSDFTQTFTGMGLGSSYDDLKEAFSEVIEEFQRTRKDKEEHYRYLQTVVQHIGIGLIVFAKDGEVELINNAAKRLFKISALKNIHQLKTVSEKLIEKLLSMKFGAKALVKLEIDNELLQLAIYSTEFKMRGRILTLVSIQNIQSELEEKELEAWQKLIRVLTHEIMNSVTPISSLASTVNGLVNESKETDNKNDYILTSETISDVREAMRTIQKRSEGLLRFVDAYRNVTLVPQPKFQIIRIDELFLRIESLMKPHITKKSINFSSNIDPEGLELTADPELIEQVLINLVLNSIHAVNGNPGANIEMIGNLDAKSRTLISVIDNGSGILEEVIERIFIPFFTTKKGGSGIGLSLSRQIMRLHKGSIKVKSAPNVETEITLRF